MGAQLPASIDVAGSILFLGSGFSADARNILNEPLLTGEALLKHLAKLAGEDASEYDLQTIADELRSRQDLNLHQILYELFTVRQLSSAQREILRLPWRRIYTTNYDDAVEFAFDEAKIHVSSFNYDEEKPRRMPDRAIVHLHGVIRRATESNVLDQLVLNEATYVRQHFEKSPWYDEFARDVRFSSTCFFLGYRLRDHHISALLMQNPAARDKTFFVTRPKPDALFEKRVRDYGEVAAVGLDAFAKHCTSLPTLPPVANPHSLRAFKFIDPFKDKRTLAPPTAMEVRHLVTYGAFNYERCLSSLPHSTYVAPRQDIAEEATRRLEHERCLLVHSRIGNGKTIFLYILAYHLSGKGYRCFWCRSDAVFSAPEIELLKSYKKVAIFFDSYNTAIDSIEYLNQLPAEARFIVAVRTGVQEVRLHEIQSRLPSPLARVALNELQDFDRQDFLNLLDQSGVGTTELKQAIQNSRDVRDIVVSLYDNKQIRDAIKAELTPLISDAKFRKVFVASHLLSWVGQSADTAFLRAVTGCDAYVELSRSRELAVDLFSLEDDEVQVRSAMFSEYVIQNHLSPEDILDAAYYIIIEAVKRKAKRRYQAVLSTLLRYVQLERALRKYPSPNSLLISLFERLRRDIDVNQEPLFWLQYSILATAMGDLLAAEGFIETAYLRAEAIHGFHTFQIDTYALKLFLDIETQAQKGVRVARFEKIRDKLERVRFMIADESRRAHAVEVLQGMEPFINARRSDLEQPDKVILTYELNLIVGSLEYLSPEQRAYTGADLIKSSLARANNQLLTN